MANAFLIYRIRTPLGTQRCWCSLTRLLLKAYHSFHIAAFYVFYHCIPWAGCTISLTSMNQHGPRLARHGPALKWNKLCWLGVFHYKSMIMIKVRSQFIIAWNIGPKHVEMIISMDGWHWHFLSRLTILDHLFRNPVQTLEPLWGTIKYISYVDLTGSAPPPRVAFWAQIP